MDKFENRIIKNNTETELIFIGMGLLGFKSCSLEALAVLNRVEMIFIETYTNFILEDVPPQFNKVKERIIVVDRGDLEENDHKFLDKISGKVVAILVPGDPFIATTHNSLRLAAIKRGFRCKIIHNASILSSAASISGLSSYRFGRTVTCPFPENKSDFPYKVIKWNKQIEAHTLVLLDLDQSKERFLTVDEAISILSDLERKKQKKVFQKKNLVIGLAKIGYKETFVVVGDCNRVSDFPWRKIGPPQALIVCADPLHITEKEALETLWHIKID
ncbi:MAG: diphthine synthase [Candidatus Hermodarchaeota archaeon]